VRRGLRRVEDLTPGSRVAVMLGSAESENWLTNREIIFEDFQPT